MSKNNNEIVIEYNNIDDDNNNNDDDDEATHKGFVGICTAKTSKLIKLLTI